LASYGPRLWRSAMAASTHAAETSAIVARARPLRLRESFAGIAAVSRLGKFTPDVAPSEREVLYRQLDEASFHERTAPSRRHRRARGDRTPASPRTPSSHAVLSPGEFGNVAVAREREIQEELEESNRQRAARYVAEDKWEEATTPVWFPVERNKRLWDVLILFVLLYSILIEPFRIGFGADAEGASCASRAG
jgi:hypothetical protein